MSKEWDVFISHASEDKDLVARPLAEELKRRNVKVWYDEFALKMGDSLRRSIEEGLTNSKYGIVILSQSFFSKEWPQTELDGLATRQLEGKKVILPVWHNVTKEQVTKYSPILANLLAANTLNGIVSVVDKIIEVLAEQEPISKTSQSKPERRPAKLCDRINHEHWDILEQAAIRSVTAGGLAAMGYYRQPLHWPSYLKKYDDKGKNPSTVADLEATTAILQTIDPYLSPLARRLGCSLTFLGEETEYEDWLKKNLRESTFDCIKSPEDFFIEENNSIRVILDGIDGTGNFIRGIPLFCSAVAILISDQVRVSAIYDPIHHVVSLGQLFGPYDNPNEKSKAWSWQIATGNRIDLTKSVNPADSRKLKKEAIGIHLTRSNAQKLHEFLKCEPSMAPSVLERLANKSGGVYALNSGIVAMADIAEGALGGFVNNITNLWDVAAGEVLVRACKGKVTDFDGSDIAYSYDHKVSVVAAATEELHSEILDALVS